MWQPHDYLCPGVPSAEDPDVRVNRHQAEHFVNVQFDENARWLTLQRGPITLQVNFGSQPVQLPRPQGQPFLSFPEHPSGEGQVVLGPESCSIWRA